MSDTPQTTYKRVLLKISGEALMGDQGFGLHPPTVERIANEGYTLTVCPLSNLKLCVIDDIAYSPVKTMLEQGIKATVNSDDPSYFGGYINDNYNAVAAALDLSIDDIARLAVNSFEGSFLDQADIAAKRSEIEKLVSQQTR